MRQIEETDIECTGERYMPEFDGDWTLEHTHRYLLACELARGKTVLDIACGEGYGSRMLADVAKSVSGVDISGETIERAAKKYPHPTLAFIQGSVTAIPLPDASIDLVTSFETIEHLAEQESMLREIRRVLRPDGVLIISSPDKRQYSDLTGYNNEYHVKELYRDEFVDLLKRHFNHMRMLGQRVVFGSVMGAEDSGPFLSWRKNEPDSRTTGLADAEYLIALAGNAPLPEMPSGILKLPLEQSDRVCYLRSHLEGSWDRIKRCEAWEKEARGYISQLEARCEKLQDEKELTERELFKMRASRSWKITAPLRSATAFLRRVFPEQATSRAGPVWPPDVRALETDLQLDESSPQSTLPLGVFLHIYYTDLVEEILACLRNLPGSARIHVSTDTEAKSEALTGFFAGQGFGERVEIRVCPNKGWDLGPFFVGFADVIPRYPLILRLHTKRSTHIPGDVGEEWRKMLFSTLAGNPGRVNAIMRAFENDPALGMVCPPIVDHYAHCLNFGGNYTLMRELLSRNQIRIRPDTPIDFPMGSMFWCRPEVLAPWLSYQFTYYDFSPMAEDERDSSLAHALERLFFFGCGITGFSWARLQAFPAA